MTGNEYQALAMRTKDGNPTGRMLSKILTCDMAFLRQQDLVRENPKNLNWGGRPEWMPGLSR